MPRNKAAEAGPRLPAALPLAATAVQILEHAREASAGLIFVARSERRAASLAGMLSGLAPDLPVFGFPGWDCMPYDRAPPSAEVMGARIAALRGLLDAQGGFILVTTPDALLQRVPPRDVWKTATLDLAQGEPLDIAALERFLIRTGYILDERVDEAGEAAIRGAVVDLFPGGFASPVRIDHADGEIVGIRSYDPLSQRTLEEVERLTIPPASELVLPEDSDTERYAGMEHALPEHYGDLETLFDYAPGVSVLLEAGTEGRRDMVIEQIADAYETRRSLRVEAAGQPPRPVVPPSRLYLDSGELAQRLKGKASELEPDGSIRPVPQFVRSTRPGQAMASFVEERITDGDHIVLAGSTDKDLAVLKRRVPGSTTASVQEVANWEEATAAPPGSVLTLQAGLDGGFTGNGTTVVAASDLLGSRAGHTNGNGNAARDLGLAEGGLRVGDAVIHIDHGMAALRGLETLSPPGGPVSDAIVLEFAGEAKLLVPAEEIGRIWRYGGDPESVTLDKLGGTSWEKRRAELDRDIAEAARELTELAAERAKTRAPALEPPRQDYERFAAGFPYSETPDQAQAIVEALEDMASGRPMNRLVCGDVGFGKTEVALRAAAAAVLAGKQVAVVAPTTVLVRQHVRTFRRRFAGFGVEVAHLSRLVKASEARSVKEGLARGDTQLVVGTHALAGKGVRFKDLGLLVIDEEHRFGTKQKEKLRSLGDGVHVLTLTATPIPRTLQTALVGLQDLSIIASPPTQRQPIRTFLVPWDAVTVRAALMRERRRGGQSFVVCPRIEDIEPMAERLKELVPELQVVVAHGKMPADEMDAVMVDFADGVGDVLLATNIIESGLDVPRANTILVWRADRFGLAQLHQLRGRVGRGRARGTAYLLTDPGAKLAAATEQRLRTLEAADRLGAGFAISARDLDLRGAGDLVGEKQAGHVKLIGMALYRHMLERALLAARGEAQEEWEPEVRLGLDAHIPEDYVPEADVRIELHARIARDSERAEELLEEIEDRFGPAPEPVRNLVALARLRERCRALGVAKLEAGPAAVAVTLRDADRDAAGLQRHGDRLVLKEPSDTGEARRRLAMDVLARLAG